MTNLVTAGGVLIIFDFYPVFGCTELFRQLGTNVKILGPCDSLARSDWSVTFECL